jgi:polyisoprenoid-binding protein YceI
MSSAGVPTALDSAASSATSGPAGTMPSGEGAARRMRSPRFLDSGRHPVITFTSQIITLTSRDNDAVARVTGTVTVRDTTCLVSVPVSLAGRCLDLDLTLTLRLRR